MKIIFSITFLLLFLVPVKLLGQKTTESKTALESNYNIPPGLVFGKKFITSLDLSYKLTGGVAKMSYDDSELKFGKVFLNNDLESIKEIDPVNYNYYTTANAYFNSLSEKAKHIYTKNELWYIYVFDQKLKTKLLTIK